MARKDILESVSGWTRSEVNQAITDLIRHQFEMSMEQGDTSALLALGFQKGFTSGGAPMSPLDLGDGVISLQGVVRDTSKSKHSCSLYTVRMGLDYMDEWWQWDDECPTLLATESVKVGPLRRTVSLHHLPSDALVLQHNRTHDGSMHKSKTVLGSRVVHHFDEGGDVVSSSMVPENSAVIRRLPPPKEGEW